MPVFALLALVPVVFLRAGADVFVLSKATMLWIAASFACAALVARWHACQPLARPPLAVAIGLGAFALIAAITTVLSPTPALAVFGEFERNAGLTTYLALALLALYVAMIFRPEDVARGLTVLLAAGSVVVLYGIAQAAHLDPFDWSGYGYAGSFSTLGNPNLFAGFCAVLLPIAVWAAMSASSNLQRGCAGLAAVGVMVGALVSESAQGPIAAVSGSVVFLALALALRIDADGVLRGMGRLAVTTLTLVIVGAVVALGPLANEIENGLGERKYFWAAAFDLIRDEPLNGVGLDSYGQHFLRYRPEEHAQAFGTSFADSPHNVPLGMFTAGGFPLGLSYLSLLVLTVTLLVHAMRRSRDRGTQLLVAVLSGTWVSYQVQAVVSMDTPPQALVHWFTIGAAVAVSGRTVLVHRRSQSQSRTIPLIAGAAAAAACAMAMLPLRADLSAGSGYRAAASGEFESGLRELRSSNELMPWRSRYWLLTTAVLEEYRDYPAALDAAVEAAEREPGSSEYAVYVARLADHLGSVERAGRWYLEAVRRDPLSGSVLAEAREWARTADLPDRRRFDRQLTALAHRALS